MSKSKKKKRPIGAIVLIVIVFVAGIIFGNFFMKDKDIKKEEVSKENTNTGLKDYEELYRPVLEKYYDIILNSDDGEGIEDGEFAVFYVKNYLEKPLAEMGFALKDINGDNEPELLIGSVGGKEINALYTLDHGKPKFVLYGVYRDVYYLLDDNSLFNTGSASAMISIFANYTFNGEDLDCKEYYFTDDKDGNFTELVYFKNDRGEFDVTNSTMINEKEYMDERSKLEQKIVGIDYTPFEKLNYDIKKTSKLKISTDSKDIADYKNVKDVVLSDHQNASQVYFITDGTLSNFTIYEMTVKDVDKNGVPSYNKKEVYNLEKLEHELPLNVNLLFSGDSSQFGITVEDENGNIHSYVLQMSGYDGSILVNAVEF